MSGTVTTGNHSSGTYLFNPPISELLLDAFERCGKRTAELTPEMISSGRRSLNLVLVNWANRGVNLWTVAQFTTYMPQAVAQYTVMPQIVDVLVDSVVLRQYQMGAPSNATPAFTTTVGSSTVTVNGLPATPSSGQYINIGVMTSVGGLILSGFYQVISVPGSGQATFNAGAPATAAVTAGGAVPQFVATASSTTVTVNLANHGLLIGQTFNIQVTTIVGGVTLLGPYTVTAVNSASQFTITIPYPASAQTVMENGGNTTLSTQATTQGLTQSAYPDDIRMYPLSRTDYDSIPLKGTQGRPTSFWINRQISPVFNIWPTPDANGPYELRYYASQQVQDADIAGGQTLNVPYRFIESFTADLAAHLAMKWADPQRAVALATYAQNQWTMAGNEDIEKVSAFLCPDTSAYYD